jgi:hypothetical protein
MGLMAPLVQLVRQARKERWGRREDGVKLVPLGLAVKLVHPVLWVPQDLKARLAR